MKYLVICGFLWRARDGYASRNQKTQHTESVTQNKPLLDFCGTLYSNLKYLLYNDTPFVE